MAPAAEPEYNPEINLPERFGEGLEGRLVFFIAVAFSAFQVTTAFGIPLNRPVLFGLDIATLAAALLAAWAAKIGLDLIRRRPVAGALVAFLPFGFTFALLAGFPGGMPSQVMRALHVGFLCLLAGGMLANHRARSAATKGLWWGLGLLAFAAALYQWVFYIDLVTRAGSLIATDLVVAVVAIAALMALVWRAMGWALPIIAGLSLAYCLFGHLLPSPLNHRGYDFEQVMEQMVFGTEGIYGLPTLVSATYIFLFILFGAFMEKAGVIRFFNEVSMALFGAARGGPAKVCIASSALMGTVAGSGVANVVASGQFTIPLMKRFGFPSAFAGGVEATSSMGGVMMPPVMGAVAFIMAETLGVPFIEIMKAAIIPAILYFGACYWAVHLEAGKLGLHGLPRDELPSAWGEVRDNWFLLLPLVALVVLLFGGYTPLYAGAVGLALTVVFILGTAVALGIGAPALRIVFWVGLGLLTAASLWTTVALVVAVVAALVGASLVTRGGRATLVECRNALADGARQALPVGLACVTVGLLIGMMTLTGVGTIIGNAMIGIGRDNLLVALLLTMVFNLVLGIGLPTVPNYIITSSLAAPILLELGVPLIVSHMFVFYFGIMADLSPPVALAAYAAAPMAKASGMKIGWEAMRIALPGFVWPFIAVYSPQLMLQPVAGLEGSGYWAAVAFVALKAVLTIILWGAAAFGYLFGRLAWWERLAAAVAAMFLVVSLSPGEEIGLALAAALIGLDWWRSRRVAAPAHPA